MGRSRTGSSLILVFLVLLTAAHGCDASLVAKFRKLVVVPGPKKNQIPAPAPAPAPAASAPDPPTDGLSFENCTSSLKSCPYKTQINVSACLVSSSNANMDLFLLVENEGESPPEVNVTINDFASHKIQLSKHQIEKVNVSGGRSSSLVVNVGNGACKIVLESPIPNDRFFRRFPNYANYATQRNGAYLLILSVLVFGGTCACCMLAKRERHVDGVPYQELEMGHPESPSGDRVETAERWDQGWDDDWDEIKVAKSPRARRNGNVSTNGIASKASDEDGWENNWDD